MTHSVEIKIRIARPDDAAALLAIYAPYITDTAITFEYTVPTLEEFTQRVCRTLEKYPYLVAEANGLIIGYAYASAFRVRTAYNWSVETSIYVRGGMKGHGIGRKLYNELEKLLARQNITNLYACIATPCDDDTYVTMDSVDFHRHLGYTHIGQYTKCAYKFGQWFNMVMMEKVIGEHLLPHPDVIPFPELAGK